jgi:hypothetical protein
MDTDKADASGDTYYVQDLPDRYIKIRTLEGYITAHVDEFGKQWSLQASVGTIPANFGRTNIDTLVEHPRSSPGYLKEISKRSMLLQTPIRMPLTTWTCKGRDRTPAADELPCAIPSG